jgi:hypothetical protein
MLNKIKAYSAWQSAPILGLNPNGRAETDILQIRNIEGLEPVDASINVSPLGSVDGESYTGSNVLSRNIVLTIRPNPDWDIWSPEALRKLLYQYFMPKSQIQLVFESDDMDPVEIFGYVESVNPNHFSSDPEFIVSIICPDPYFIAVDPVIITGQTIRPDGDLVSVTYNGNIQSGFRLKVTHVSGTAPVTIEIQVGDPAISYFGVAAGVDANKYFEMNSLSMRKFVQNVSLTDGIITNLLSKIDIEEGSEWPHLHPGINDFAVITDVGVQDWELRVCEKFGGL